MDGSEISSGQGKGEAQIFGANQALALTQRYDMNRMKYGQKQLSDLSKKSENISYDAARPGDSADFAKQGETVKNLWTQAQSQPTVAGKVAGMTAYNGAVSQFKTDIATSKSLLALHAARITNGMKMQGEDIPDGYNDKTDKVLSIGLRDPALSDLYSGSDMNAIPHYNLDASKKFAADNFTHKSGITSSSPTLNGGEKGIWNDSTTALDVDQAHDHFEEAYRNDPSMKRQTDMLEKSIAPSDLQYYQNKYGADKVKNTHDAAIWHNVNDINSTPVRNHEWKAASKGVNVSISSNDQPTEKEGTLQKSFDYTSQTETSKAGQDKNGKALTIPNVYSFRNVAIDNKGTDTVLGGNAINADTGEPVNLGVGRKAKHLLTGDISTYSKDPKYQSFADDSIIPAGGGAAIKRSKSLAGGWIQKATLEKLEADPSKKDLYETNRVSLYSVEDPENPGKYINVTIPVQNQTLRGYTNHKGDTYGNQLNNNAVAGIKSARQKSNSAPQQKETPQPVAKAKAQPVQAVAPAPVDDGGEGKSANALTAWANKHKKK